MVAIEYMKTEPRPSEILEAITTFADNVDRRLEHLETDVGQLKSDMVNVKSQMVTKSYLDDKLCDLKGDMVSMLRKEDQKANRLVNILAENQVLTPSQAKDVLSFKVFP